MPLPRAAATPSATKRPAGSPGPRGYDVVRTRTFKPSAAAAPQDGVLAEPEDAEEERAERSLEGYGDEREAEDPQTWVLDPVEERHERDRRTDDEGDARQREPVLEPKALPPALEAIVVLAEVDHRVRAREQSELDDAEPQNGQDRERDRDSGPVVRELPHRAEHDEADEARDRSDSAGEQKKVRRAVHEHEADMVPRVAEARELGVPDAHAVADRHLVDAETALARLDHHLGGELHPRRRQLQLRDDVAADRSQPAVRVRDTAAEEQVQHAGEQRIADVAVRPRHCAWLDLTLEPRSEDEI